MEKANNNNHFLIKLVILNLIILMPFIIFQKSLYVITTPSMSPTINVGDIVVKGYKDPKDIKAGATDGDILIIKGPEYFYKNGFDPIFWGNLDNNTPIVHRAIDKIKKDGTWYFLTKGDNNYVPDGGYKLKNLSENYILIEYNRSNVIYVPETEILGVVFFVIPYIGYLNILFPFFLFLILGTFIIYLILKALNYQIKLIKL